MNFKLPTLSEFLLTGNVFAGPTASSAGLIGSDNTNEIDFELKAENLVKKAQSILKREENAEILTKKGKPDVT